MSLDRLLFGLSRAAPASLFLLLLGLPRAQAAEAAHELPERFHRSPFSLMSLSVGHPNRGYQVRAKKLRPTQSLKIKAGSRDAAYGHPALVLMLRRSAGDVARASPGSVMLVGDLSKREGGPLVGHHSHQSGRDADVGFYVKDTRGRPVTPPNFVGFDGEGKAKDHSGLVFDDHRNYLLFRAWARDQRAGLAHVFVSDPLKNRLLRYARKRSDGRKVLTRMLALLSQPERASTHDDHFHVRISCPRRQEEICREHSE